MAGYVPATTTYPADFINYLSKVLKWVDSEPVDENWSLNAIVVGYQGEDVGKLLFLDDQWQFEPDVTYWGLSDRTRGVDE